MLRWHTINGASRFVPASSPSFLPVSCLHHPVLSFLSALFLILCKLQQPPPEWTSRHPNESQDNVRIITRCDQGKLFLVRGKITHFSSPLDRPIVPPPFLPLLGSPIFICHQILLINLLVRVNHPGTSHYFCPAAGHCFRSPARFLGPGFPARLIPVGWLAANYFVMTS